MLYCTIWHSVCTLLGYDSATQHSVTINRTSVTVLNGLLYCMAGILHTYQATYAMGELETKVLERTQAANRLAGALLPLNKVLPVHYNANTSGAGVYSIGFIMFGPDMLDVPLSEFLAVIAHECGHVYFEHPFKYTSSTFFNHMCERAADEFAIMHGFGPAHYDYMVRDIEGYVGQSYVGARYYGCLTHPSHESRLRMILELAP